MGSVPSKRMSECDSATKNINFIRIQAQKLAICKRDNTERLVDLIIIYFFLGKSGLFQCLGNRQRGGRSKRNRFLNVRVFS